MKNIAKIVTSLDNKSKVSKGSVQSLTDVNGIKISILFSLNLNLN